MLNPPYYLINFKINIDNKVKVKYNGGEKMKKFTYIDYMKYQTYIGNINYFKNVLQEDCEKYKYNN